jgi:hypothetical protein
MSVPMKTCRRCESVLVANYIKKNRESPMEIPRIIIVF